MKKYFIIIFYVSFTFYLTSILLLYDPQDITLCYNTSESLPIKYKAGQFRKHSAALCLYFFASASFLLPVISAYCCIVVFYKRPWIQEIDRLCALILYVPFCAATAYWYQVEFLPLVHPGGLVGKVIVIALLCILESQFVPLFLYVVLLCLSIIIYRFIGAKTLHNITICLHVCYEISLWLFKTIITRIYLYFISRVISQSQQEINTEAIYTDPFWQLYIQPAQSINLSDEDDLKHTSHDQHELLSSRQISEYSK